MKKAFWFISILTGILACSCQGLVDGAELKKQIDETISIANSESFTIAINPLISESISNITPTGNVEVKKGNIINIEAKINNNYSFVEWRVYSKSKGTQLSAKDVKIKFTEPITNYIGSDVIVSTKVELLDVQKDLEIVPYCKIKKDTLPPTFYGDIKVSYSKEAMDEEKFFTMAQYDQDNKLIRKTTNRAARLYFDILADDLDKPYSLWICETEMLSTGTGFIVDPESDSAIKHITSVENCFKPYKKTVYQAAFEYDFKTTVDMPVLVEVKVVDESNNASVESKKFIVTKDTKININPCSTFIENDSLEVPYETILNNCHNIFIPQIFDSFHNGEEYCKELINNFDIAWGNTEECTDGSIHISEEPEEIEKYVYDSRDGFLQEIVTGYKIQLPENSIKSESDLFIKITATDSIGNTSSYTNVILAAPVIKGYGYKYGYYLVIDYDSIKAFEDKSINPVAGVIIYASSKEDTNLKIIKRQEFNNYTDLYSFGLTSEYSSFEQGSEICDIYVQFYFGVTGTLLGQISKITLVKGEALNEKNNSADIDFDLSKCITYDVEFIKAVDTGIEMGSVYCKINIPDNLKEYEWEILRDQGRLYKINDYKTNVRDASFNIIATAYDKNGMQKIYDTCTVIPKKEPKYDVDPPFAPVKSPDNLKNYDQNFSIQHYAGSGVRVCLHDENQIQTDEQNTKAFMKFQNLPSDIYTMIWDYYKEGFEDYPYTKIYEHDFYNQTTTKPTEFQDFVIPFYALSKNNYKFCVYDVKDNSPNHNRGRYYIGFIKWNSIKENPLINIVDNKAEISLTSDLGQYVNDNGISSVDYYSVDLEYFNKEINAWVLLEENSANLTSLSFNYNNEFSLTEDSFYRARIAVAKADSSFANSWSGNRYTVLTTEPVYFYKAKQKCNSKLLIQGTNGIQISHDQPVLVQTYYSEINLGSKLEDWEIQAQDINTAIFETSASGTTLSEYYYDAATPAQSVPENFYYIVAAYFTDGSSTCTSVMQK